MYSRVRSRAGAVLLAAVAVTGNGLLTSAVHAQGIGADPATNATPAADRFRLPAVADLATDATRGSCDQNWSCHIFSPVHSLNVFSLFELHLS